MGVLKFDAIDDLLNWTTLTSALGNVPGGDWTAAGLAKRNTGVEEGPLAHTLSVLEDDIGPGFTWVQFYIDDEADLSSHVSDVFLEGFNMQSVSDPYLWVLSSVKDGTPRLGWKLGQSGTWDHQNMNGLATTTGGCNHLTIGGFPPVSFWAGWIGVIAWWSGAMSDANKELLGANWRTSDWWTSAHGQPTFLAELNVVGTSVVDVAGNATGLSVTGTTLDAGETLSDWTFNGTGAGGLLVLAMRGG